MTWKIHHGDAVEVLRALPEASARCCVTSPPYFGLRDYGVDGQIGLEPTPAEFIEKLVALYREVRRVLTNDGTLWLNIGDSYASSGRGGNPTAASSTLQGSLASQEASMVSRERNAPSGMKPKDLMGIPWRVALALQADGWYLRSDIIWSKPNPMPESVTDRPTKAHEYLFLLAKNERYYYNAKAVEERATNRAPGNVSHRGASAYAGGDEFHRTKSGLVNVGARETRNRRTVWTIATQPFPGAHFAVMPEALVEPCILAGSEPGDTVIDPTCGAATVGVVARRHQRNFVGAELNGDYVRMGGDRIVRDAPLWNTPENELEDVPAATGTPS